MSDKRPDRLAIALAQLNAVVGDIDGNKSRALEAWGEARGKGADLVVFPELFIDGYPPEDLVLKPAFVAASKAAIEELARETADGPGILIGTVWPGETAGDVMNAVACLDGGEVRAVRFTAELPNYAPNINQ